MSAPQERPFGSQRAPAQTQQNASQRQQQQQQQQHPQQHPHNNMVNPSQQQQQQQHQQQPLRSDPAQQYSRMQRIGQQQPPGSSQLPSRLPPILQSRSPASVHSTTSSVGAGAPTQGGTNIAPPNPSFGMSELINSAAPYTSTRILTRSPGFSEPSAQAPLAFGGRPRQSAPASHASNTSTIRPFDDASTRLQLSPSSPSSSSPPPTYEGTGPIGAANTGSSADHPGLLRDLTTESDPSHARSGPATVPARADGQGLDRSELHRQQELQARQAARDQQQDPHQQQQQQHPELRFHDPHFRQATRRMQQASHERQQAPQQLRVPPQLQPPLPPLPSLQHPATQANRSPSHSHQPLQPGQQQLMQPQVVQSHAQPTQAQAGPSSMQPPQPASRLPPAQKNTSQPQQGRSDVPQQSRQAQKQSHPPEVSSGESSTGAALFHDHNQQQNNAGNATAGGSSQAERPVPATRQLAEEQLTRWGFRYFLEGGIGVLICKACRCAVKNVRAHMRHHVLLGQLDALREVEAAELLRAAIKSGYPEHREISEASEAPIPDPKVMPISDLETGHGYCCTAENCNFVAFRFKDVIKHMKDTHPALPCDDPLFQPRYSVLQFWNNVERPFEVARGLLWYDPSMVRWPPDFSDDDTDLEWSPDKVPARSAETRAQSLLRRHGFAVIKKFKATVCVICRVAVKASEEGLFTHLKQMHLRLGPTASRLRAQEALAIIDRYFPDSFAPEQLDRPEVTSAPLPYLNIFSHGFACNGCNFTSAQQSATHLHMKKKHPTDGATMRKCREFQAWMKDGRGYRGYFQVNHNPDDPDGIRMRKDKGRALDGAAGTADGDDGPSAAAGPSASEGDGEGSGQTSAPATAGNPPPSVLPTESSAPGASGSAPGGLALGGLAGQTTQPISPATPPLALAGSSSAGPSASAIRSSPAGAVSALAVQQVDRIGISAASAMAAPTLQSNENPVPANRTTGTAVNGASSNLDKTAGQQSQSSAATLPIVNNGTGMASDVQTSATSSSTATLAASSAADASSAPATGSDGPQGGGNAPAAAATSSAAPLLSASPASTGVTASKHGETPSTATGSGRTTQLHQVAASIAAPQASGSRYTGVSDDDYDDTMPLFQLASARSAALLGTAPNNFRKPTGKRASSAAKPGRGGSQAASGSKLVPYSSMPPRIAPTGRASLPARLPSRTTTQPASGPVTDTVPPAVPAVSVGPATAPTTALQALVRSAARHAVVPRVMGRSSMPSGSSTVAGTDTTGGFDAMQVEEEEEEEEEPEDEEEEDQLVPPSEIARRLASLKFKPRSQSALTLWQLESEGASSFAPIRRDVSTSVLPTVSLPDDWDRSYSVLRLGPERDEIVLEGGTSIFAAEEDEGMPDVLAASASAPVDQDASASADNEATANVGSARLHSTPTAVPVIQRGSSLEATGSASGSTSSALGPTPSAVQARRGAVAARGRKQQKTPSKPRPKSLLLSVQRGKAALKRKRAVGDVNGDEEEVDQLADDGDDDEPEEEEESESQVDDEDDDETYEDSTANRGRINPGIISTRLRP